jgi:hypothetical protein
VYLFYFRIFVGDPETFQIDNQTARVPYDSTLAMTSGHFQITGELMAASIVQGGPTPDFLAEWVYKYLSSGIEGIMVDESKIEDQSVRQLITRVSIFLILFYQMITLK